ncbi:unnamed protein product [Rotaria sp. Silwood2]|nr:unnamed protein product [Rotaria sp. Silwood2]CAF4031541.1 unnamed protein product [Rotaria sp. Silwood2]
MASKEPTIVFITYFISVYVGYFNVINGLIGNIINILVFTQLKLFQRNQSAFYLTVASIVDSCQLIFAIATRITVTAFGFDLTRTSLIWCKLRAYLVRSTRIISIATICLAAIDQYLSTNYHVQLRQMSTFKSAQFLISILIIFSFLYCIPFLIFHETRRYSNCAIFHRTFNYFYSFAHYFMLLGILPIFISSLFSLLAYRNVRRIIRRQMAIVRRRLDRQLTAMILLRVALFVITTLPYISFRIYQINTSVSHNHTDAVGIMGLINVILITIYNIDYSVFKY